MIAKYHDFSGNTKFPFTTLAELARERALRQPEQQAYTFLIDGEFEKRQLTYQELDRQARAVAALLQEAARQGDRVLLLYPAGLEVLSAFFGCLYAGMIAVTAPLPEPNRLNRTLPRLQSIIKDAQPTVALTVSPVLAMINEICASIEGLQSLRWFASEDIAIERAAQWYEVTVKSEDLALLQYTSGSTARPKGVMVSHANLLHNSSCIKQAMQYCADSILVMWVPHIHDHGLVEGIVQPLYTGFHTVLMPSRAFIERPVRWLQAISHYHATHSGGPNFAYELCVRKVKPEQRATLDLSSWKIALNAAEPIRAETLERFTATFAQVGFHANSFFPAYGLAEATLIVTNRQMILYNKFHSAALERHKVVVADTNQSDARTLVACGRAITDTKIAIVDPESLKRCAVDEVGEIWLASPSVTQGYWQRSQETKETFHAYLADTGEGPFLRTGDLGFLYQGELYVTGRIKDLIIIHGLNHYPQDIEKTVEQTHPALRLGCCAAFSVDINAEERLVVVAELDLNYQRAHPELDLKIVQADIRQALVEQHDLQIYAMVFLKQGSLPKTSSGKIQRHACRSGFLSKTLELASIR
ncbi:MAG: fatty acyl-AMP ligase [Acidobacteriota bacterium]